jgi:hypothetical protein
MADIVLTKNQSLTMDMDPAERALMDEIDLRPARKTPSAIHRRPEEPNLDVFTNPVKKVSFRPMQEGVPRLEDSYSDEGSFSDGGDQYPSEPQGPAPSAGYSSIEDEKADLLNKLARLEKKGFKTSGKLNAYSEIEQIRTEYKRIMFQIESDQGIKFARRIMIACVTGIEFVNRKYDPFDVQLDGWSENMMENIEDYDSVFEELHAKYKDKIAVAPEIKLIMMVGGSAMMFHLTKSMFKGVDSAKVMKDNPDLMQNMMDAVKKSREAPPPPQDGQRREMRGPGIDIGSMMGGFAPPPAPMNSRPVFREEKAEPVPSDDELMSDIVSVTSETKDLTIKTGKKKGKKEVTI